MKKQLLMGAFLLGSFLTASAQLTEDFEGAFPPTDWTLETTNSNFTWEAITGDGALEGLQSVNVQYDPDLVAQDESLVSPSFTLPAGAPTLTFITSLSYNWAITEDNYDFIVSVSTDGGANWTAVWDEADLGTFDNYTPINVSVPLADYAGQTVMLKFQYIGTDGAQLVLDAIDIVACPKPSGFAFIDPQPTTTAVNIGWTNTGAEYEFEYGELGFEQGSGTPLTLTENQVSLTELSPSTDYAFYIRTSCGDDSYSDWVGPIAFNTVFEPTTPTYAYGFETPSLGGWSTFNATSGNATSGSPWVTMLAEGDFAPQEGDVSMAAGAYGAESDAWLFSRGIELGPNDVATLTYYVKKRIGAGTGNVNNLGVFVGTDRTVEAQTTNLVPATDITNEEWVMEQVQFAAPSAGVYYFSFNYTAPAQAQANFGWVVIDNVEVTATASIDEVSASQLSVFPNPANNVVNIVNTSNNLVNAVEVVDLNGRTVKSVKFDGVSEAQINISELSSGVYMMNITTDNGSVTKKIVKN
ncbi:hypothetical protein GCM10007424_02620 [Flavobacterium suaedae]|uniref:Secretion system C-terminal sorting domain-containing protein n=1 Tax=Flavobacterium suaedae TaxID=1767027 RepID=A0ABQ1JGP8_9FLAO|nr:choice-of-anchor J domain-containing protein [Flavobacterium suaedae]GGB66137.1 hypothetical protein GCM10007424_02620 [Flavobacterium suaedae]